MYKALRNIQISKQNYVEQSYIHNRYKKQLITQDETGLCQLKPISQSTKWNDPYNFNQFVKRLAKGHRLTNRQQVDYFINELKFAE